MSAVGCLKRHAYTKERNIEGQYTFLLDDASIGVIVYDVHGSRNSLPKVMADRCSPDELYEKNLGLVKNTIYRLGEMCKGCDYSDLEQEGRIALWTAAVQFDPSYGAQFSTYAITLIRRAIMHYAKAPTSRLFGSGKLDVVSIQEMQERVDGEGSNVELFAAPQELTPVCLSEDDEIMDLLLNAAAEMSRVKDCKGIKALIMQMQGYDSKTISRELEVAPKSFSALITAGRQALKSNPRFLKYISVMKNEDTESAVASLLDSECVVRFSDSATFDTPRHTASVHLTIIAELLSDDEVAECLLDNIRLGEDVIIVDEDTWTTTRFIYDIDEIRLLAVTSIRSRSTAISRIVESEKADVSTFFCGDKYAVRYAESLSYDYTRHSAYAHLSLVAGILANDINADYLLDMVRIGEEAVILDEDSRTLTRFIFGVDNIRILSVSEVHEEEAALISA